MEPSISHCSSPLGVFTLEEDNSLEFSPDLGLLKHKLQCKSQPKVSQTDFLLVKVLGKGAFGKVYLVRKTSGTDENTYYAMKVLKKHHICIKQNGKELTQNERIILERIRHPFLIRLYYAFQTEEKLFLILEYAPGGELFQLLAKSRLFLQSEAKVHLAQIALALNHLHQCGVVYRDLKPENILRDADGYIKLTDFGMSKIYLREQEAHMQSESISSQDLNQTPRTKTFCGTLDFMAPEALQQLPYTKAVDWWSFGILTFFMLTGNLPFKANNTASLIERICTQKLTFPRWITAEAQDLIRKCLRRSEKDRIGFQTLIGHRFFQGINWAALEAKAMNPPPQKPALKHNDPEDVSNFDAKFTGMPIESFKERERQIEEHEQVKEHFFGFSFVSPLLESQDIE
jgi:serine/threonine protein kinase